MNYSCLEELQVDLDLHALDKTSVLSKAGCKYKNGWLAVTDDGICHLFDKDGNLDDIRKVIHLKEKHIRKDIQKIVIPNSVIYIENWAFSDCNGLTSVTIGNSVMSIGDYAFSNCNSLKSMTIPDSVISIQDCAFEGCHSLTSITIGNGVTSIEEGVFERCNKMTNLTFEGKTLEQVRKMDGYPWGIKDVLIINVE